MSTPSIRDVPASARAVERTLVELMALERELIEQDYVRRTDALERVRDAMRRLGEIGSPQGILGRLAEELGTSSSFDRVMISEARERRLEPRAIWSAAEPSEAAVALEQLRREPIKLEYPLIEDEVASRRQVEVVTVASARSRASARLVDVLGWSTYVVAAVAVQGQTVGLLHADSTASGRTLDALDAEVAAQFTEGLGGVFERAVLRETLRRHHDELQAAVKWMSGRLSQLSLDGREDGSGHGGGIDPALIETLTSRELEVLRLLARGQTNNEIAGALVVREGTVKYHVKNILRKLGATSRADAVSRFVRAGSGE